MPVAVRRRPERTEPILATVGQTARRLPNRNGLAGLDSSSRLIVATAVGTYLTWLRPDDTWQPVQGSKTELVWSQPTTGKHLIDVPLLRANKLVDERVRDRLHTLTDRAPDGCDAIRLLALLAPTKSLRLEPQASTPAPA